MPKARTIALLVAAATSFGSNSLLAETQPCGPMEYERNPYTICEVDLRKHMLRLYWKNSDGKPYAYLSSLPRALTGGGRLLFATNAGMFDPALKPVGLYVEQGRELVHVNTTSGYGNFHMKPNGVHRAHRRFSLPPTIPRGSPASAAAHSRQSRITLRAINSQEGGSASGTAHGPRPCNNLTHP